MSLQCKERDLQPCEARYVCSQTCKHSSQSQLPHLLASLCRCDGELNSTTTEHLLQPSRCCRQRPETLPGVSSCPTPTTGVPEQWCGLLHTYRTLSSFIRGNWCKALQTHVSSCAQPSPFVGSGFCEHHCSLDSRSPQADCSFPQPGVKAVARSRAWWCCAATDGCPWTRCCGAVICHPVKQENTCVIPGRVQNYKRCYGSEMNEGGHL